jgi:hypothetical protein
MASSYKTADSAARRLKGDSIEDTDMEGGDFDSEPAEDERRYPPVYFSRFRTGQMERKTAVAAALTICTSISKRSTAVAQHQKPTSCILSSGN